VSSLSKKTLNWKIIVRKAKCRRYRMCHKIQLLKKLETRNRLGLERLETLYEDDILPFSSSF
jgi:hypothetical protein